MRWLLFFIVCILHSGESWAERKREGVEWQWYGLYSTDALKFSAASGDANFTGTSIGGGLVQKVLTKRGNGFAIRGEFAVRNAENTANSLNVGTAETMKGASFLFGARYYALDFYLGMSGFYMPFAVSYVDATRSVESKYSGYGLGVELGVDLFLGDTLFFSPKAEYQMISAQPGSGNTMADRVNSINLAVSVGLAF